MNKKNTIVIAVLINAGLLAVLLIAALSSPEEVAQNAPVIADVAPKFDDKSLFAEAPPEVKPLERPVVIEEPLLHKLPPMVAESAPEPVMAPVIAALTNEVVVKKGDSLEKIAKTNRTSVDEIIKINHLPSSFLKVGQVLKIPTERSLPKIADKKPAELGPEYYTMKVGENPWAIAMKHHMKVEELLKLNGLNEEKARKLKPGDRLRIR
jgi:peptidoglycan endopeptidase LytF